MRIITRTTAIQNLRKYIGKDLRELALQHGVTTFETGKQNKGWKGLTLERLAGLETNVSKAPNGLTYELKSVSFKHTKSGLFPKETMAITMINQKELLEHSFFQSHCWSKMKSIVFCAVLWTGQDAESAKLLEVTSIDFLETDELIKEIELDYEFIRKKLRLEGFEALSGKDGKWIQARTKGPGHGSTSRAFYARTKLVHKIFEDSKGNKII